MSDATEKLAEAQAKLATMCANLVDCATRLAEVSAELDGAEAFATLQSARKEAAAEEMSLRMVIDVSHEGVDGLARLELIDATGSVAYQLTGISFKAQTQAAKWLN